LSGTGAAARKFHVDGEQIEEVFKAFGHKNLTEQGWIV